MKNSPKQVLESLLPQINKIFIDHGLNCKASWRRAYSQIKFSAGFELLEDSYLNSMLRLEVQDPLEEQKREFWKEWNLIIKQVDQILLTKFDFISMNSNGLFRLLKLKNS